MIRTKGGEMSFLFLMGSMLGWGAEIQLPDARLIEIDHSHGHNGGLSWERVRILYDRTMVHYFDFRLRFDRAYRENAEQCYGRLRAAVSGVSGRFTLNTNMGCLDEGLLRPVAGTPPDRILERLDALERRVERLERPR